MENIAIKDKIIGELEPCFIIAEAGVNHDGSLKKAMKLVDIAAEANVDAIKFQTFKAEGVVITDVPMASYQIKNTDSNISQLELLKSLELKYDDFKILKEYCDKKEIIFLSTPHSFDAIDFLDGLVPAFKVSSGDLTNIPTLKYIAAKKKPIIIGTGMGTLEEINDAIKVIESNGNDQIILLHCTSNYPCSFEDANLKAMLTMKSKFNKIIGFSDHTLGTLASLAAVAMGAKVVEKHFTHNQKSYGPDHKASLEPKELHKLVKSIREIEKLFGNSDKIPTLLEKDIMKITRKSIVARVNIPEGTVISEEMLTIKRPGTGLPPKNWDYLIGKTTIQEIKEDELITLNKIKK